MPFPEHERGLGRDDGRQRGGRATPAQVRQQVARIVFVLVGPAKGDYPVHQIGEGALQMGIDPAAVFVEGPRATGPHAFR